LIYCNSGGDPQALFKDAREQGAKETRKWPYDWVSGVDYPHRNQRVTVKGQIALKDPMAPGGARMSKLLVGLAHPAYTAPVTRPGAPSREIDWQTDAKHYEFWTHADEQGRFTLSNVRPGSYHLRAFADGVLGEFAKADITIAPGKSIDHGQAAMDAGSPRQAVMGNRHPQPHRFGVSERRRLQPRRDGPAISQALSQRCKLRRRKERLPEGLVLRARPAF
jgi:hypothetical protein